VTITELHTHSSEPRSTETGSSSTTSSTSRRKRGRIAAAGLAAAALVLAATGTADAATTPPTGTGGGSLSGPADGGSTGIIASTSASGFTITTATGLAVNITETASTKVVGGPASAVRKGTSVLVLGLDDSTTTATSTITADAVVIQPFGDGGAAAAKRDGVIPITSGTSGSTKVVGTIPTDYTEGEGTIISGTAAYAAVAAAEAVYPGGVIDRVVQLSDGSYEVHDIGVNWPHHIFVSTSFKVVGAND
jgi:hypothetical protein